MDFSLPISCPGHRRAVPLHACVEYPQDKVEDAMIAKFALRSTPGRRQVRGDKCGELRLGELNGNRRRSRAFCHIAHRKWVDEKPERSSPESLIAAYNTKGYGTHKTRNYLSGRSLIRAATVPNGPLQVLIDTTGLHLYGAGQWLAAKHGAKSRRKWRIS
jgi:hypothetical protein